MAEKLPITDSPWYWVLLFAVVSLGALLALSGKYGRRQSIIERKYQAREHIATQSSAARAGEQVPTVDYSTAEKPLIVVWPLAVLLTTVAVVAFAMLVRRKVASSSGTG